MFLIDLDHSNLRGEEEPFLGKRALFIVSKGRAQIKRPTFPPANGGSGLDQLDYKSVTHAFSLDWGFHKRESHIIQ